MKEIVLQAKNIKKSYHKPTKVEVLKKINLSVKKNETIAIMGDSGEGKTTLLHILGCLEKKDSGNLTFLGKDLTSINSKIGFVFQSFNLLDDLTLLENVLMAAYIHRKNIKKGSETYKKAIKLITEVGLKKRVNFLARDLSGGEKQRASIARAFLNDPEIIFADEPSGNLDSKNSNLIHKLLVDFAKKKKKSLIVATHNKELSSLCDKVYMLKNGSLSLK